MRAGKIICASAIVVLAFGCEQRAPLTPTGSAVGGSADALIDVPGSNGGRPLSATMTGPEEVPPGDPDGTGNARFTLNHGQGQICFELHVSNIVLPAIAAHIHKAPVGVAGPILVPLTPPDATGFSTGCVTADRDLVKDIIQDPSAYYVNVHNMPFQSGAVRGQLSK